MLDRARAEDDDPTTTDDGLRRDASVESSPESATTSSTGADAHRSNLDAHPSFGRAADPPGPDSGPQTGHQEPTNFAQQPALGPDGFVVCAEPPAGMVCIPGGPFVRGAEDGQRDERPRGEVTVSTFHIDRHEVTNAGSGSAWRQVCELAHHYEASTTTNSRSWPWPGSTPRRTARGSESGSHGGRVGEGGAGTDGRTFLGRGAADV